MSEYILNNWWQLLLLLPVLSLGTFIIGLIFYISTRAAFFEKNDDTIASLVIFFCIIATIVGYCNLGKAEIYEYSNKLKVEAPNYKAAAKKCYNILTKGIYPGEELGLAIIDLCINPIKGSVK